jgi:hypothetical protein
MPSYYGYQPRDIRYAPDFAEAGSNIADKMFGAIKEREEKRRLLDKEARDEMQVLENVPMGDHEMANHFFLNYANDAMQNMLTVNTLRKKGLMKIRDVLINKQNLSDGTEKMIGLYKKANDILTEADKRRQVDKDGKPQSQYREQWQMSQLEKMGDLSKTFAIIDPKDGTVSLAQRDEKGKIIPQSVMSINNALGLASTKYNYIDSGKEIKTLAKDMADKVKANPSKGIKSLSDALETEEGKKFVQSYIDALSVDRNKMQNILTEFIKSPDGGKTVYDFTYDPKEAEKDPSKLLLIKDPNNLSSPNRVFNASPEQKQKVADWVNTQFRTEVKSIETPQPQFRPLRPTAADEKVIADSEIVTQIGNVLYGTPAEAKNGNTFLQGLKIPAKTVKKDKKEWILKVGKEDVTIPMVDDQGNPIPKNQLIQSSAAAIAKITNQESIKRANISKSGNLNDYQIEEPRKFDETAVEFDAKTGKALKSAEESINAGFDAKGVKGAIPLIGDLLRKNLPKDMTKGMKIEEIGHGLYDSDLRIIAPNILTEPVIIPKAKQHKDLVTDILRKIYEIPKGQKLSPSDLGLNTEQSEKGTPEKQNVTKEEYDNLKSGDTYYYNGKQFTKK